METSQDSGFTPEEAFSETSSLTLRSFLSPALAGRGGVEHIGVPENATPAVPGNEFGRRLST